MGQGPPGSRRITVGPVELDPDGGHMWKDGVRSHLPEQPLAVLQALLDARGGVVSRGELRNRLWPNDTYVDFEHGVNAAVKRLREALGDNADSPRFIETIPRRGYRLIAPVDHGTEVPAAPPSPLRGFFRPVVAAVLMMLVVVGLASLARRPARDLLVSSESAAGVTRVTHDGGLTMQPSLSDDGEVLVYASDRAGNDQLDLWVAPADGSGARDDRWIPITTGESWDDKPRWSPSGSLLYFVSHRDGFRCIWAQRLDPSTKKPLGAPFAVEHFHNGRLSMMNVRIAALGFAVARDRLVFNLGEVTGNIWSTRNPREVPGRAGNSN